MTRIRNGIMTGNTEKQLKRILTSNVTRIMTRNMTKKVERLGTKKSDYEKVKDYE